MKSLLVRIIPVLLLFNLSSCIERKEDVEKTGIRYLGAYDVPFPEPSGLSLAADQKSFWSVSDENSTIYRLSSEGKIIGELKVEGFDLEGITAIDEETIAVVLERAREIVVLDTSGKELKRVNLDLEGEENSGLEGITYNSTNGHFFLLNEKKPSLLMELDEDLNLLKLDTLKFSKDLSGICYDGRNKALWMLSDESQLIMKMDLDGNLIEKINISIVQPEGITVDKAGERLYIVSDNREALYVFELN